MSVQVENLEKNMAKLTIEVPAEELEKALQNSYLKNRGKISVPGFRKGKVPRQLIEKMYGPGIFYEDAANELIPEAYAKAAEESGLEIVSQPEIDVTQIEKGQAFIFTAEVAVKPEVTLGAYKGVEVPKSDLEVTEEEIQAEVDKERESNSRTITVEDRPVADKDIATIDFEGFVDGQAFEGGKGTDYPLTIGSGAFIPGFEEQLIGAEIGKEVEVHVTFPENYHAENLKGKEAMFKCTVKEVRVKELPEADDEFAMDVSEFDTMEEYRADIRKNLTEKKEKAARAAKEDAVIEKIIADSQMEIPDAMVNTQVRQLMDEFAQRIASQGLSMEQYMQFTGATPQALTEQMKPQAMQRIQSRLVLEAVAAAENIQVSEEELKEEIQKMADLYKMEVEKVEELLDDTARKQMKDDIAIQKAVELVRESAVEK
ncbi:MAG: trigger factor [Lachnospiraceae bacterium]|jgi:trigger factor|nr:trigger factor [Lachnospiraceae bacterium]MCI9135498.1 trigger factor [Lachnospiraceae bacterium]